MIFRILYWMLWPLIWFYAPLKRRVRVVIINDGKVLVVKNNFGSGRWQLPGGGIKFSESVVAAAKRELKEELGIDAKFLRELHDGFIVCRQSGLLMRLHFTTCNLPAKQFTIDNNEIGEIAWLKINQLTHVETEVKLGLSYLK